MLDRHLVRSAADLLVTYEFAPWFYGDSVGLEGLVCASELLEDPYYEGFVHGIARGAMSRDGAPRVMDNTVPGRVLTELAVRRGDTHLLRDLGRLVEFLALRPTIEGVPVSLERAGLMQPYGGGELTPEEDVLVADPGPAVYVDCLHFDPPFLVTYGQAVGDEGLVEEGIAMAEAFSRLLQEPNGFFDHFYLQRTGRTYIPGWTRGQGWAAMGLLDVLESIGPSHPRMTFLRDSLQRLAGAMVTSQRPDGHWGSLATPDAPTEASAAAFFAAVFLRMGRLGLADSDIDAAAESAFHATMAAVDAEGRLGGVSATVWSSTHLDHYNHVPLDFMVPWSQGPLLMALWEMHRRESEEGVAA